MRIVFAGFSDGIGESAANLRLSVRRADAVRKAVGERLSQTDMGSVNLAVEGFGEAVPIACDDTPDNRRINRRVEVWVSQR